MIRLSNTVIFQVILFFFLIPLTSCTSKTAPPPDTDPSHIPGYLALQEEFGNLEFSPLRNRRVVLDPGHGGFFRGALGPGGLTEAEVNLGVALYLRGLLEWAGAQVYLTRTADYDFLTPADSTLSTDLSFRSSFTDSLQPDVFISIHHNSTASQDPDINETQTYYPLGDDGASLDLARSIHRHLVLNLEISPAKILPGNFHVLRKATVPAVLGEPAMISNPVMEGRLSLASSHELEAQAYFLGLLDYFSAGQPRFSGVDTLRVASGIPSVSYTQTFLSAEPGQPIGPAADPSSFHLTLDGKVQGFDLSADGRGVTWRPAEPLPVGSSVLRLSGKNLKGRSTPISETVIITESMVGMTVAYSTGSSSDNGTARTMLFWETRPGPSSTGGFLTVNDAHNLLIPPRGKGWFLLPEDVGTTPRFEFRRRGALHAEPVIASPGPHLPPQFHWRLLTIGEAPVFASSIMPPHGWHNRLIPASIGFGHPMMASGSPALAWQPGVPVWIEAKGVLPLIDPGHGREDRAGTMPADTPIIRPRLLLHQLFGKTIILDPAGGGTNSNGTYPLGTRGSDLNLETARQVQLLLEGAGATVLLTRRAEVAPDPQQKVLLAGKHKADLFLTIARALPDQQTRVQYHPGSKVGLRWGHAMTAAMAPMDSLELGTSYAYLLRHTACPALEIRLQAPTNASQEMTMASLPWYMAEARAIFLACATALSAGDQLPPTVSPPLLLDQLSASNPGRSLPEVELARWDGNFQYVRPSFPAGENSVASWQTTGWPAVSNVHTLEIHSGSQWQIWRVDLVPDELNAPQFQLILENR